MKFKRGDILYYTPTNTLCIYFNKPSFSRSECYICVIWGNKNSVWIVGKDSVKRILKVEELDNTTKIIPLLFKYPALMTYIELSKEEK